MKKAAAAAIATGLPLKAIADDTATAKPYPMTPTLKGDFTLTAVGDVIMTHPMRNEILRDSPKLLELLQSDATFGNFEDTVADIKDFKGYPEALSGGGWLMSSPQVPDDLKAMGFDIMSHANNHGTDWGVAGLLETDRRLDLAGIVHAGSGPSLTAARAPAYFDGKKGRVALVALSAHLTAMEEAADGLGDVHARPGVNPLHYELFVTVPETQFKQLAAIRDMQPEGSFKKDKKDDIVTLFETKYKNAGTGATGVGLHYKVNEKDEAAILRNVRQGKEVSDFAIVSAHVHEPGNYSETPPDFLPGFAHDAIDGGADAFIGHGPHRLRGIEIYKGKPIFYSLGDFAYMGHSRDVIAPEELVHEKGDPDDMTPAEFMQQRLLDGFNSQVFYESVVAVSHYRDGVLSQIELHPIELGWDGPLSRRGVPMLAHEKRAQRVLSKLQKLSEPFGTTIEVRENVGVITVAPAKG
jgi:poly-gamma-glutamate synthesis protein (capsule biosynthesis protein)